MRKMLVVLGTVGVAAVGVGSAAAANEKPEICPSEGSAVRTIRAVGINCEVARKVIHADLQGKRFEHWRCTSFGGPQGRRVDCRNEQDRRQSVTFVVQG